MRLSRSRSYRTLRSLQPELTTPFSSTGQARSGLLATTPSVSADRVRTGVRPVRPSKSQESASRTGSTLFQVSQKSPQATVITWPLTRRAASGAGATTTNSSFPTLVNLPTSRPLNTRSSSRLNWCTISKTRGP